MTLFLLIALASQPSPPSISVSVLARQVAEGKPSSTVHYFTVRCSGPKDCTLEVVTVNNCFFSSPMNKKSAQWPHVETASTQNRDLVIDSLSPSRINLRWLPDTETTASLSFELDPSSGQRIAFGGSVLKNSSILGRVISFSYVAVLEPTKSDCAFWAP